MGSSPDWDDTEDELELRLRRFAIPVALAAAWLLAKTAAGRFILRIFFSMWLHELGHAAAAWLCGYAAFPGPWLTLTAASRSPSLVAVLTAGLAYAAVRAWRSERTAMAGTFASLIAAQLFCTFALPAPRAQQLILFAGDGGALVFGALLMMTLYAPEGSALRREWLRWGFLGIGAGSFCDVLELWWSARTDPDRIPFGMNEGAGLSDPSRLSDQFGWSADLLVSRYVALACLCLAALAVSYVRGVRAQQKAMREALLLQ